MLKRQHKSDSLPMPRAKSLFFRKRTAIATLDIDGDQLVVVTASGTGPSARISRVASGPITWHAEKKGGSRC